MAGKRRTWGRVRKLPSGRWQARFPHPETGELLPADRTFATKVDADDWLAEKRTEIRRETWIDPEAGKISFSVFAERWIKERDIERTTRDLYEGLNRLHLNPTFGEKDLADLKEAHVRTWRHDRLSAGVGPVTVAKSYRLLRAILNTAADDGMIRRNPCRIKGAGAESSPERPVLTIEEVFKVADAIQERYRAMVLVAAFLGLRLGELAGLLRKDVDLVAGTVRVRRPSAELNNGTLTTKDPKTAAGKRTVAIPALIIPDLQRHLKVYAEKQTDGYVFVGPQGGRVRRSNFTRVWKRGLADAGVKDVHFHDLRHTGNTLASSTGASLKELMARMGHASTRAAMIYQHATSERDHEIADALNDRIKAARGGSRPKSAKKSTRSSGGDAKQARKPTREAKGTRGARKG
ncbi:tyrosine-type recombinase/integrase [Embleya sp. NPDC050154]|uniref:tyrosine-type recombinase/integrase n=1 Tax=Embleya sp. NPDC050154 TaxID=3363988 RepID=UPI0037B1810F